VAHLSIKELSKRKNFETFMLRIAIGHGFYIVNTDILIKLNKKILTEVYDIEDLNKYKIGRSIQLPTETNDFIPLAMLYKDSDFSTRTQDTTAKQDKQISNIENMLEEIKNKNNIDYVRVSINNNIYSVTQVRRINEKSKADLCFIDLNGKEVGFVSHKDGNSPRSFQQWSGTSNRFQPEIFEHHETIEFIKTLKDKFPGGLPAASTVARRIQDDRLKNLAVFGNDFGKLFGNNNVEAVMQGELILRKYQDYYILFGSHYTINNGILPLYGYDPVFMAVHKKDRKDHWIDNCRLTINPLGSRTIKQFI
jgi:hypothetical protein